MCLFQNVFIFSMEIILTFPKKKPFCFNLHSVMCVKLSIWKYVTISIISKHENHSAWYIWHVTWTSKNVLCHFNQTLFHSLFACVFYRLTVRTLCSLWIQRVAEREKNLQIQDPISNSSKYSVLLVMGAKISFRNSTPANAIYALM